MSIRSVVSVIVTAIGFTVLSAGPALAHAELVGSSPADKSSVSSVTEVSVTAGEELLEIGSEAEGFVMVVTDSTGSYYGDGCVSVSGDTASMPVSVNAPGDYSVAYRVVSNDGHPVEGQFTFTVTGDGSAEQFAGYPEKPSCGTDTTPIPGVEVVEQTLGIQGTWLTLAAIPVGAGAIWLLVRVLRKRTSSNDLD
jgi:methionine-rich copper-binding protein CopC